MNKQPIFTLLLASLLFFSTQTTIGTSSDCGKTSYGSLIAKSFGYGFLQGATEVILTSAITIGGFFIVKPLLNARSNKSFKAPNYAQELAVKFIDTMTKKTRFARFKTWLKKKLGYLTIYTGLNKKSFINNPNQIAMARGLEGIHFKAGSFKDGKISPGFAGHICHEVAHIYNNDTIGDQKSVGSIEWYKCEYEAEQLSIEILFKLEMHEEIDLCVAQRVIELAKCEKSMKLDPYIYGILDAFFTILKENPGNIALFEMGAPLAPAIEAWECKSWQERFEKFSDQKNQATSKA